MTFFSASKVPNANTVSNRYLLKKELGKGGMGAVYAAVDRLTGTEIALKRVLLPPGKLSFGSSLTMNSAREMNELYLALAQEFRLMASLRHPNVNSVLDYGFDSNRQPYFTMELLKDAKSLLRVTWGQTPQRKAQLLAQLCMALAYLHRRGIIHRDLKPGNILVVGDQVKVLDFGLSQTTEEIVDKPEQIAGTVGYIAPEVLIGKPVSPQSDLFAVGVIAFEILTGASLYSSQGTQAVIDETLDKLPDLSLIRSEVLRGVVERLLQKDPNNRYQTAEEAVAAFSEAVGLPVPVETGAIRDSYLQAARFVGRTSEYNQLLDMLTRAIQGHGSALIIGGESGSGKTRLLDELRTQALVQGVIAVRGQNLAEGNAPYQMWRTPLRMLTLNVDLGDEEASVLKAVVPDIASLIGREVKDAPEVSPMLAQGRLLTTIEALLQRQPHPVLIILEDLHWATQESLGVLLRLAALSSKLPLLILGSYRDDERPDLPAQLDLIPHMKLKRLDDDGIEELSIAILGEVGRRPRLIALLKQETEGNAFFLVEIMRALSEQAGRLSSVGGMQLPEHIVAGGIEQIIRRRISRVPESAHSLLRIAAVAGRDLDLKVLRALTDDAQDFDEWLNIVGDTAVIEVREELWRFAHDKLRESILSDLPAEMRGYLHRRLALTIESVHLLDINQYTASLAYHYGACGDLEKEAHYAALAAKQSLTGAAYEKAITYAQRALQLIDDAKKQAALYGTLGDAYGGLKNYQQAHTAFAQQLALCQQANYKWGICAALTDLGLAALALGDQTEARQHFHDALQQAMSIRAQSLAVAAIQGFAALDLAVGNRESALQLTCFILAHPAIDARTRERAETDMAQLSAILFPEQIEEAQRQAAETKLSEVATRLVG
ncbi:MAG: protein kinase [Anaerolineae bacterium]